MITEYIQAAMRKAKYEILENNEGFYGEIPGFQGVYSNAKRSGNVGTCYRRFWKAGFFSTSPTTLLSQNSQGSISNFQTRNTV